MKDVKSLIQSSILKGLLPEKYAAFVENYLMKNVEAQSAAGLLQNAGGPATLASSMLSTAIAAAMRQESATPTNSSGGPASAASTMFGTTDPSGTWTGALAIGAQAGGGFFDSTRGLNAATPTNAASSLPDGFVSETGTLVTAGELASFASGAAAGDNDDFAVSLWVEKSKNPVLLLDQLAYAKRLHNDVVRECARYYKGLIYGDQDYPVRLGQIIYGIISPDVVRRELWGGPTSRHTLGQAVNFSINGVDDGRVVSDIAAGLIPVKVGTYAHVNGVHASLPFTINGQKIERLLLWSDNGVPDFVGYSFT
jgi:hypothetical protein